MLPFLTQMVLLKLVHVSLRLVRTHQIFGILFFVEGSCLTRLCVYSPLGSFPSCRECVTFSLSTQI